MILFFLISKYGCLLELNYFEVLIFCGLGSKGLFFFGTSLLFVSILVKSFWSVVSFSFNFLFVTNYGSLVEPA